MVRMVLHRTSTFLIWRFRSDTETIGPDGYNINDNCGSTHPELLEKVLETESDFGLAFDGDGDRLIR